MSIVYDERAVVTAFIDTLRPPYPHEDFRRFREERLQALERAYGIQMTFEGALAASRPLFLLFQGTASSYVQLKRPREGVLDDTLLNMVLERVDRDHALRDLEKSLRLHVDACRVAHLDHLIGLFKILWGPIAKPVDSVALRVQGFDDAKEPRLSDYYDHM